MPIDQKINMFYFLTRTWRGGKMKVYIKIDNHKVTSKVEDVCVALGYKIADTPIEADVVIIENRAYVFDFLSLGKKVIQFIYDPEIGNAKNLEQFERIKGSVFVCDRGFGNLIYTLKDIEKQMNL